MDDLTTLEILVVDDEPDLELLFKQKFRHEIKSSQLRFHFSHDGHEALIKLDHNPNIALVITDINMPQMDGLTLLDNIKHKFPTVITIILSAYGDLSNIRAAMNLGAYDFIIKPIDFADLSITINKALQHITRLRAADQSQSKLNLLMDELKVATSIQQSIVPEHYYNHLNCQIYGFMEPAQAVGGDFFDYFDVDDQHVAFVVGDVSGKGVPAALFMTVTRTLIRAHGAGELSPARVLNKVNEALYQDNKEVMFVTIFYGVLNLHTGQLKYSSAGHDVPFLITIDGEEKDLPVNTALVAGIRDGVNYDELEIKLSAHDTLVVYSDGLTDALQGQEHYTRERLIKNVQNNHQLPPNILINKIYRSVEQFAAGTAQYDDITMLVLRYGDHSSLIGHKDQDESCLSLSLRNNFDAMGQCLDEAEKFMICAAVNRELALSVSLVLNELITNIISYGYENSLPHEIFIRFCINNDTLKITMIDDGKHFDPTQLEEVDVSKDIEQREIGGLGVHLAKTIMDDISYQRKDGSNYLTLHKVIARGDE